MKMPSALSETRLFRKRSSQAKSQITTISKPVFRSGASSPIEPDQRPSEEKTAVGDSSSSDILRSNHFPSPKHDEILLDDSAVLAPCEYIRSLPSKNVRATVVQACNLWFKLSEIHTTVIIDIISDLHNASLILDDIQDDTVLRRGSPATHCVYGNAQAINSAVYMIVNNCAKLGQLQLVGPAAMNALVNGTLALSVGQSWDLKWKAHLHCPSVGEYMAMIDGKTGAMLKLIIHLMHSMSDQRQMDSAMPLFDRLVLLLGRFYQVRDDYQNLQDDTYSEQKGFCEDLDEGKISYPVIACCNSDSAAKDIILGIFREKRDPSVHPLPKSTKVFMLQVIDRSGAFESTWNMLQTLGKDTWDALLALEEATGKSSPGLQQMIKMLINTVQPPKRW
ncbi:terpenoid synthase [Penicillium sp. IBT 16267x]|nr:terpenoid synthase [Penicillium sp. IBT 16267x]